MNIHITGRHMETGAALQAHVENRLNEAVSKYFERSADINVTFSKQGHEFQPLARCISIAAFICMLQGRRMMSMPVLTNRSAKSKNNCAVIKGVEKPS